MKNELIFDVGMHDGQDTAFYLKMGFRVISIDANPDFINLAQKKFKEYIDNGQLIVLNYAITEKDNDEITFNISKLSAWSSIKSEIADREDKLEKTIPVKTQKLSTIISEYGTPYYCKIDIEGYDNTALESLIELKNLPNFISAETECLGDKGEISEEESLKTLETLYKLGYRKFKLIDQISFKVLNKNTNIHKTKPFLLRFIEKHFRIHKILKKIGYPIQVRERYNKKFNHTFEFGSSGPFGDDLNGKWSNYKEAKKILIKNRKDYFNTTDANNYGFWCDWHAKLDNAG
ncbi:FkbM family methyltransferase [Candidatus Peregrinibacteria bacterium]|nr:FkbM family methyltransferase [Candidatus Peregrinibacteria bacterium]